MPWWVSKMCENLRKLEKQNCFFCPWFQTRAASMAEWILWRLINLHTVWCYDVNALHCQHWISNNKARSIVFYSPERYTMQEEIVIWLINSFLSFNGCLMTNNLHKSITFKERYYIIISEYIDLWRFFDIKHSLKDKN